MHLTLLLSKIKAKMSKATTLLFLLLSSILSYAQKTPTELAKPIVDEGKRLYKSEMASWYGTDLFLEKHPDRSNVGGYFSYTENDISKCIFFSKGESPKVIGTISFDSSYNTKTASVDLSERAFSGNELDLYVIRKNALSIVNSDTLFKSYQNTSLNLIPLINGTDKKVYILTGPQQGGVVIFGNDYLLTFGADNKLISKKNLHRNIISIKYGNKEEDGKEIVGTMHSHLPETGEFITPTDICTLMLYAKFAKWQQHYVVSEKYFNIWNCNVNELTVLPKEAMDKIFKDK